MHDHSAPTFDDTLTQRQTRTPAALGPANSEHITLLQHAMNHMHGSPNLIQVDVPCMSQHGNMRI